MTDDHLAINRDYWNGMADDWVASGERLWASETPEWGIWGLPEAELAILPGDLEGKDAVELGCGTGYVSGWIARRGARVTGVDLSSAQLATARRLASDHGAEISFLEANAESTGLPDHAFDFAISEYGAAIWCDPDLWLREAWRLLRPGGSLVFLGHHPFTLITTPESGDACSFGLCRSYRGLNRMDWTGAEVDPGGVEFNRTFEGWMRLITEIGFTVLDYRELYAPDGNEGIRFGIPADWARQYPSEQIWRLSKPS